MITKTKELVYVYRIKCDECGEIEIPHYSDIESEDYMSQGYTMISKIARIRGWQIVADVHICDDCLERHLDHEA